MTTKKPKKPKRMTLAAAVAAVRRGEILATLDGLPVGGWPETQQAIRQLRGELPLRSEREWSVYDLIDAIYVERGGRWRRRDD